jgi:hypothetical protein
MERWQQIESLFQEALRRPVESAMPGYAKPAPQTATCIGKLPPCWRIIMSLPALALGRQPQRN